MSKKNFTYYWRCWSFSSATRNNGTKPKGNEQHRRRRRRETSINNNTSENNIGIAYSAACLVYGALALAGNLNHCVQRHIYRIIVMIVEHHWSMCWTTNRSLLFSLTPFPIRNHKFSQTWASTAHCHCLHFQLVSAFNSMVIVRFRLLLLLLGVLLHMPWPATCP